MRNSRLPNLVSIVGPTAVGKTDLAITLACALNGEIISADSRQVYRRMDIGTAKPEPEQLKLVPHHLVDVLEPDHWLSLAEFQERAFTAIKGVHHQDKLPILVGGTGQYVRSVLEGWGIPRVGPHHHLRVDFESFADIYGNMVLHERLASVDPQAASSIDYRNTRRVVRALEVHRVSGRPISELQHRNPPRYRVLVVGLTMPRSALYQRIDSRVDAMIAAGWLDEVRGLVDAGLSWDAPALSSLGYPQIGAALRGEVTLEQAAHMIKIETHRFVRQQYNWFPLDDPSITWFDVSQTGADEIVAFVQAWLTGTLALG